MFSQYAPHILWTRGQLDYHEMGINVYLEDIAIRKIASYMLFTNTPVSLDILWWPQMNCKTSHSIGHLTIYWKAYPAELQRNHSSALPTLYTGNHNIRSQHHHKVTLEVCWYIAMITSGSIVIQKDYLSVNQITNLHIWRARLYALNIHRGE